MAMKKQVTRVRGGAVVRRRAEKVTPLPARISGPFWSDALQAYRIEFSERDSTVPGGWYTSSFLLPTDELAQAVAALIPKRCNRRQWGAVFKLAVAIAKEMRAVLYRMNLGGYQRFDPKREGEPVTFEYSH